MIKRTVTLTEESDQIIRRHLIKMIETQVPYASYSAALNYILEEGNKKVK